MDVNFAPNPSRHTPIVTYVLLVVCFGFTMAAMFAGADTLRSLTLSYSMGIQPIQWLASPFIHADMIQFVASAIFIAAFGLFIEGRIGPGPFLVFFLAVSLSSSAVDQVIMQGSGNSTKTDEKSGVEMDLNLADRETALTAEEKKYLAERASQVYGKSQASKLKISKGASAAIFGLIAIFLVIDPGSRMKFGGDGFEVPLIALAGLFVVIETVKWFLGGFSLGGAPVHLIGLVPGLVVGGVVQATGIGSKPVASSSGNSQDGAGKVKEAAPVEKKKPMTAKERKAAAARMRKGRDEAIREKELLLREAAHIKRPTKARSIVADPVILEAQQAVKDQRHARAFELIESVVEPDALAGLTVEEYNEVYKAFSAQKKWRSAASVLEKSLAAHPDDDSSRRLQLGRIMLAFKDREQCQKVLSKVKRTELTSDQKTLYRQLVVQLRQIEG